MPKNYKKGSNFERVIVKKFNNDGLIAFRVAGSGRLNSLPDVFAIKNGKFYAFQCKVTKAEKIYLNDYEKFKNFHEVSKIDCFFAVKFEIKTPKKSMIRFYKISEVKNTISIDMPYLSYEDLIKNLKD